MTDQINDCVVEWSVGLAETLESAELGGTLC